MLKLIIQDGFYHYFNEWDLGPLHTWFSYNLASKITTYVLVDCPERVKETIVSSVKNDLGSFIHRPFAIDILIAEQCALWREDFIQKHYIEIFDWVFPPNHINTILLTK